MKTPQEIIKGMLEKDSFSKWMGVELVSISEGACTLKMVVQESMLNGFEITHGGLSYSLSDSALAFAANSKGFKCVSVETSISHVRTSKVGDVLTASAVERHRGKTLGIYEVVVSNQMDKVVALFKGTVHVSTEVW